MRKRRKRRKRRRLKPIFKFGLLIIGLSVFIYAFWTEPNTVKEDKTNSKIIKKKVIVPLEVSKTYSSKLNDKMSEYIDEVKRVGVPPCLSIIDIKAEKRLHRIKAGRNYLIDNLDYSHPYLSTEGKALLDKIDAEFGSSIEGTDLQGSRFILTSLTRTKENVTNLKKININASDRSAHMYGGCFDITYRRFDNKNKNLDANDLYRLKETLAEIIYKLMQQDKCWATKEKREPCFHVVSR